MLQNLRMVRVLTTALISVHNMIELQGPPTQEKVYQNLLTREVEAKLAGAGSVGDAQLVQMALDIEDDQFVKLLSS